MALSRRSNNDNSNLNNEPSLRETRVEQRRNYTDACTSKGADGEGIRRGTNRIYNELFGGKPAGDRDDWTDDQQQQITVGENFAASHVRSSPERGNDAVVEASGEGAKQAKEYIEDQSDNGNWWSRLFS